MPGEGLHLPEGVRLWAHARLATLAREGRRWLR